MILTFISHENKSKVIEISTYISSIQELIVLVVKMIIF